MQADRSMVASDSRRFALALACGLALLAGCASTQVDAQWSDPQFQGRSLRGSKVLVVCEAPDLTLKRTCQDQLAAQVVAFGATPSIAADLPNPQPGREQATSAYLPAAREARAQAVLSAAVVDDLLRARGGPSVGVGIGGFGGGRVGVGGGIGISLPIGGSRGTVGAVGLNGALTDVASGQLMWSGKASTSASGDAAAQLGELARAVAEGAQKAGFF